MRLLFLTITSLKSFLGSLTLILLLYTFPLSFEISQIKIWPSSFKNEDTSSSKNDVNNVVNNTTNNSVNQKSKVAAGLFGIFLGSFGVHNFYLGFTGKAVAQLLITILSCGILSPVSAIWGLIEGILLLAGETSKDAYGNDLKE